MKGLGEGKGHFSLVLEFWSKDENIKVLSFCRLTSYTYVHTHSTSCTGCKTGGELCSMVVIASLKILVCSFHTKRLQTLTPCLSPLYIHVRH